MVLYIYEYFTLFPANNGCESLQMPCENGATCVSLNESGAINCECVDGYDGVFCENGV